MPVLSWPGVGTSPPGPEPGAGFGAAHAGAAVVVVAIARYAPRKAEMCTILVVHWNECVASKCIASQFSSNMFS